MILSNSYPSSTFPRCRAAGWVSILFQSLLLCPCFAPSVSRAFHQDQESDEQFFESRIRPLLIEHCLDCHSAEQKTAEGGLALDSAQGWQRGGGRGPAIVPHEPDNSLLIQAVSHSQSDFQMPPDGRLQDSEIQDLKQWIASGAADPRKGPQRIAALTAEEADQWWAIAPIPEQSELARARRLRVDRSQLELSTSAIDDYVLSAGSLSGVVPLGRADARTLIRRATYDLTGLPPTSLEVHQFEADTTNEAYLKLVDRLLMSPRYGERWGRHWLDLMRYADYLNLQVGDHRQGSVVEYYEAWKYRDWVIDAFNSDMPYDRFLHQQIAGDTYPKSADGTPNSDGLIATTWYALGPWDNGDADKHKIVSDIVDDQINVIGQSMLGVTLSCARCHDHKFDPITIEDYYGLAGIFYSSRVLQSLGAKGAHTEVLRTPVATPEYLVSRGQQVSAIDELEKKIKSLADVQTGADSEKEQLEAKIAQLRAELLPEPPLTMAIQEGGTPGSLFDGIQDVPIHRRGKYTELGPIVPRGLPQFLARGSQRKMESGSGRVALADWIASAENPLTARVMANRVWQWHFGRGLVDTPNNFGHLGSPPTHPELLDYLARRLIDSDWSLKSLHREIMASQVYQRACLTADGQLPESSLKQLLAVDPDNRWLTRFQLRRLDAQELRDSILQVCQQLSTQTRGPGDDSMFSTKRSVYIQSPRYQREYFAALFDAADNEQPTPVRNVSTVAPQALFFLNHPWMVQMAKELALSVRDGQAWDAGCIQRLYRQVLAREPSSQELSIAQQWLQAGDPVELDQRFIELCQMLLSSNEFMFVE